MSVSSMEQKLAELLLLSSCPDVDSGRLMIAAGICSNIQGSSTT
jgi:hypothetical protein